MKRTQLPKQQVKLTFKQNTYNPNLYECITGAKCVASIEKFNDRPRNECFVRSFNLYTCMPHVFFEGSFETYEAAERRANWRANI